MRQHRIAAIPADGIGKEVMAAGLEVLRALGARDGGLRLAVERRFPSMFDPIHGSAFASATPPGGSWPPSNGSP